MVSVFLVSMASPFLCFTFLVLRFYGFAVSMFHVSGFTFLWLRRFYVSRFWFHVSMASPFLCFTFLCFTFLVQCSMFNVATRHGTSLCAPRRHKLSIIHCKLSIFHFICFLFNPFGPFGWCFCLVKGGVGYWLANGERDCLSALLEHFIHKV